MLNAMNGVFIIFANPYVGGVLQTMLSQASPRVHTTARDMLPRSPFFRPIYPSQCSSP